MKTYVEISVEKELPKDDNMYAFVSGNAIVGIFPKLASEELLKNSFDYYLKPLSLPELMEEYASYCVGSQDSDMELTAIEFLTQKGIL